MLGSAGLRDEELRTTGEEKNRPDPARPPLPPESKKKKKKKEKRLTKAVKLEKTIDSHGKYNELSYVQQPGFKCKEGRGAPSDESRDASVLELPTSFVIRTSSKKMDGYCRSSCLPADN